jgi:Zn-dependent peptidase ImmA (M78 family)
MIELVTSYSFSQVPIITYDALEAYAEDVLRDAKPDILLSPCPIDVVWFLEIYLKMDIVYRRLSYDRQVLGMTAFNAGYVQIRDDVTGEPDALYVNAGTAIIEPTLQQKRNAGRLRFSLMHEGVHFMIHRKAFAKDNPCGSVGIYENQYLAAKEGRIDYSRSQSERTDIERIERQADFLAAAILMPKNTLRMAYKDFFRYYGEKPRALIRGQNNFDDCLSVQLPQYIAKIFEVSNRAATIRLEKLDAITGRYRQGQHA